MRNRTILTIFCVAMAVLVALAYVRYTGLPPQVSGMPYIGRFLRDHIGTHVVIRENGRLICDVVTRGYHQSPKPAGFSGFWNALPTPRIVRAESYDTNGVVVASVEDGKGTYAVFNSDGSIRRIVPIANGIPAETEQEPQPAPPSEEK